MNIAESLILSALSTHIHSILPRHREHDHILPRHRFPCGVPEAWPAFKVAKLQTVIHMLTFTLENRCDRCGGLISTIIKQSIGCCR
jgi:hypothetical protein